jgi:uncharacterized protein (DUF2141 family)
MRRNFATRASLYQILALTAMAVGALTAPLTAAAAEGLTLKVRVDGFRNEAGQVFICLWENATNFPKCEQGNSAKRIAVKIVGGVAEASFDGLIEGKSYAVSAHHDENGNGKVEKNAFGIALEGIGISGNPEFSPLAIRFSKNSFAMKPNFDPVVLHLKHMFR